MMASGGPERPISEPIFADTAFYSSWFSLLAVVRLVPPCPSWGTLYNAHTHPAPRLSNFTPSFCYPFPHAMMNNYELTSVSPACHCYFFFGCVNVSLIRVTSTPGVRLAGARRDHLHHHPVSHSFTLSCKNIQLIIGFLARRGIQARLSHHIRRRG